jgi:hypothetical protein
MFYHKMLP